jgi:ATP-dependent helicase/nuclease subunit B
MQSILDFPTTNTTPSAVIAKTDEAFLKSLARHLLQKYGKNIHKLHVVLPTRRACVYMRYYLSALSEHTFIAPIIQSIDDFVAETSALEIADPLYLLFELFSTYKLYDKIEEHTLEKFTPLGTVMLRDFDMIDRNMADGKAIFTHLADTKRIDLWAEGLGEDEEVRKSLEYYFEFWKYLKDTYSTFRNHLLKNQKAYAGLAYRWLAENIATLLHTQKIYKVIFAGFNQLTVAEETFIRTLLQNHAAEIHWDMDKIYVADQLHEASRYFRQYLRHEHQKVNEEIYKPFVIDSISQNKINIDIISVNSKVLQAKVTGHLLENIITEIGKQQLQQVFAQHINHTAILLPEESLLMPLLYSLPIGSQAELNTGIRIKDQMNITMGLSMDKTPLFNLLQNLFRLQKNIKTDQNENLSVYYKDFMRVLRHPFIFYSKYQTLLKDFLQKIQKENRIFISFEMLNNAYSSNNAQKNNNSISNIKNIKENNEEIIATDKEELCLETIFSVLFRNWNGKVSVAIQQLFDLVQLLDKILDKDKNLLEAEYLLHLYKTLKRTQTVLGQHTETMRIETFRQLLFELLKTTSVPFYGEPLAPMHIMGMLETHALDFENIIILSCNEGILPKGKLVNSIIPFEIRAAFGLPTHKETDALHAYTFYRLFHRAKNISLIYAEGTGEDSMQSKEKSRFITQITQEWKHLKNITITQKNLSLPLPETIEMATKIKKTSEVVDKLKAYLEGKILPNETQHTEKYTEKSTENTSNTTNKQTENVANVESTENLQTTGGLTPSYINTYLKNPLEFFKKKVLNLKNPDEIEEWLESNTFGNLMHGYLEDIIVKNDLLGKDLDEKELQKMLKDDQEIEAILVKLMEKTAGKVITGRGKNMILKRVAQFLLKKFMEMQVQKDISYMIAVEKELKATIKVQLADNSTLEVLLKGNADRIDMIEQKIRVVDYKTGHSTGKEVSAKTQKDILEQSPEKNKDKDKIVQLMIYRYLLLREVQAGNIQLPAPYDKNPLHYADVQAGFYFFQKLKADFIGYKLEDEMSMPPKKETEREKFIVVYPDNSPKAKKDIPSTTREKHEETALFFEYVENFIGEVVRDMLDETKDFTTKTAFGEDDENQNSEESEL